MSYDIWLESADGDDLATLSWNYTSNMAPAWCAAGADLAEYHGRRAGDVLPELAEAIRRMLAESPTYRAMDSPNGWGSWDTLVPALTELAMAFARHPDAVIKIWR